MIVLQFTEEQFRAILSDVVRDALRTQPKAETPKYYTPAQLSELVGWKLTTVYQNHHNGLIPGATKAGNRLLFDSETVLAWIAENAIPTRAEKVAAIERKAANSGRKGGK